MLWPVATSSCIKRDFASISQYLTHHRQDNWPGGWRTRGWAPVQVNAYLHRNTHLLCKRNWALCICSWVPVIVMIRSLDPGSPSSMTIWALDCRRISWIRAPPFPIIAPASYNFKWDKDFTTVFPFFSKCQTFGLMNQVSLRIWRKRLTSFGMVTWVEGKFPSFPNIWPTPPCGKRLKGDYSQVSESKKTYEWENLSCLVWT